MRTRKLVVTFLSIVILVALAVCLIACDQGSESASVENTPVSISVTSTHRGDYVIGQDVDFSEITVTITYSSGSKTEQTLSDEFLSEENREKFFVEGVHSIFVTYGDLQDVLQINVTNPDEIVIYKAQFYSNGGTKVPVLYTDVIGAFPVPEREGYTFMGWYASYDLSGDRAVSPYRLTHNVDFYARWKDDRLCNVSFYDEGKIFQFTDDKGVVQKLDFDVEYGTSISLDDKEKYPDPSEKEGKVFKMWQVTAGNVDKIVEDVVVVAVYESVRCTVQIEYWDGTKLAKTAETITYGNRFSLTDSNGNPRFTMPTQEGHTSRWVIYPKNSETFIEFPDGQDYVVVKGDFSVKAQHDINTYSITIYNGLPETQQSDADLKAGTIVSTRVYDDAATYSDFRVNYDTNFIISNFTQNPVLYTPQAISGYNVCWCYVITTLTGEEWRNARNEVWDEETQTFVVKPGEERTSNFFLYDRDGNYLARVQNGDLYNIRGDVVVRAKYYKMDFSVRLLRRSGTEWVTIGTFTEKYRTDFKLYDPAKYAGTGWTTAQEVESYYLLHNVARWSFDNDVAAQWRSIYYNGGNDDDWDIEWYASSGQSADDLVDFSEQGGEYGYYEIRNNLDLYCKDIDLRRYTVVLYYDYNFAGTGDYCDGAYNKQTIFEEITEKEPITRPTGSDASVIRRYPAYGNKSVTYEFDGWYDYPYEPDGNGVKGDRANFDTRTRNVVFYAHYKCETTYAVRINDRTQREKYADTPLEDGNFDVGFDTITYLVPAGTLFTSDMIYKGTTIAGVTIQGSVYYERASFMESVLGLNQTGADQGSYSDPKGPVTQTYNEVVLRYDPGGDYDTALANARAELAARRKVVSDYEIMLTTIYSYDYKVNGDTLDKALFSSLYTTPYGGYHDIRRAVGDVENDIEILEGYAAKLQQARDYYDENQAQMQVYQIGTSADTIESGLYKRYLDSPRDLNAAYGKNYEKSLTDPTEKIKFKFAGWYMDASYAEPYPDGRDIYFEFFASADSFTGARTQLDLYAKWADEEKGSEGLVFRAVYNDVGEIVGVVVVDYMDKDEYEHASAEIRECGYNNFESGREYSVNFNDSELMPTELGQNIDLQIPAGHGGPTTNPYPVLGIMANAFVRHGIDIKTVALPDDIQFFEEGAFVGCYLDRISGKDNAYVNIVEERAVYQIASISDLYLREGGAWTEILFSGNTLIAYASKFDTTALVDGTAIAVLDGTERIGAYAFFAANILQYVDFGDDLIEIGDRAFENSKLSGSDKNTASNRIILPDTLTTIGAYAFRNCGDIREIGLTGSSSLTRIGRDSLTTTGWYVDPTKKGVVVLNGIVVGVRDCSESDFAREGEVLLEEDGNYYYENAYGKIYYDKIDANRGIVKIYLKSVVSGIADYAFECSVGSGTINKRVTQAVESVVVEGDLEKGVGACAFKGCANMKDLYVHGISAAAVLGEGAFTGCSKPTVHVSAPGYHASWTPVGEAWSIVVD